jgi:hypothetical protein
MSEVGLMIANCEQPKMQQRKFSFNRSQSTLIPGPSKLKSTRSKSREFIGENTSSKPENKLESKAMVSGSRSHSFRSEQSIPCVLHNIDPYEIRTRYLNGEYDNMVIGSAPLTFRGELRDLPASSDRNMERYQDTHDGSSSTIVTTGQEDFNNGMKNLVNPGQIDLTKHGKCKWCRKSLNDISYDSKVVGIPYSMEIKGTDEAKRYIFKLVPNTKVCGGNCLLRYAMSEPEYRQYIPWIKFLFHLVNPSRELSPAKDWDLHQRNGGLLSDQEYYNDDFQFTKNGNIITLPTKMEYAMVAV